jgi:hypothetical protein
LNTSYHELYARLQLRKTLSPLAFPLASPFALLSHLPRPNPHHLHPAKHHPELLPPTPRTNVASLSISAEEDPSEPAVGIDFDVRPGRASDGVDVRRREARRRRGLRSR